MMMFEDIVADSPELTTLQIKALGAILATDSFAKAAKQVGVNRSTIFRWRRGIPAFAEALAVGRKQLAEKVMTEARATWHAELSASRSR